MVTGLSNTMYSIPILFLVFNRPEVTKRVFEQIRAVRPAKLYIAADGPRMSKKGEDILCHNTREIVLSNIDWECDVKTFFRTENLGCGKAVSEAITWFFENEEAGVILEDDCLPSLSFFEYVEYCLLRYWDNPKIMHIGGNNFFDKTWGDKSYFYSAYNHIWGWASWRRAWKLYQYDLIHINERALKVSLNTYFPRSISESWFNNYKLLLKNKVDTWDYQWTFCIWLNHGLCTYPNYNLVSNIGFGQNATHTHDENYKYNNLPYREIEDISSPKYIRRNVKADIISSYNVFAFKNTSRLKVIYKFVYGKISHIWKRISTYSLN
jgi:hypothetical protein